MQKYAVFELLLDDDDLDMEVELDVFVRRFRLYSSIRSLQTNIKTLWYSGNGVSLLT